MPVGAETLLSAGCSGRWYFDWLEQNYGRVRNHIGVEAYSPQPADLPGNVTWLQEDIDCMISVPSSTVDLVFAGQTVEHLWPQQLVGFLQEARRVLRPGGHLIMDSPNRFMTQAMKWYHPEHTAELRIDEAVRLVEMAGFRPACVKGLWLCYDRDTHRLLELKPDFSDAALMEDKRVSLGEDRPEDSFIWWIEAVPDPVLTPQPGTLDFVQAIHEDAFDQALKRWFHIVGTVIGTGRNQIVMTREGEIGFARFGPYVPLQPGRHRVDFRISLGSATRRSMDDVATVDVSCHQGTHLLAQRRLSTRELGGPDPTRITLDFENQDVLFGVEFRVYASGQVALSVATTVDYQRLTDRSTS
jgi:SAM-dependent methyltransferase